MKAKLGIGFWAIFLALTTVFITSCSVTKEPKYKGVKDFKVRNVNGKEALLKGNIVFHNPNDVGAKVHTENLSVWFGEKRIATAQTQDFRAKKNSDFEVPVLITVPIRQFLTRDWQSLLGGILGGAANRSFDITLKGDVVLKVAGVPFRYDLDETHRIKF